MFEIKNTHNILSSDINPNSGKYPYLGAGSSDNSIITYTSYNAELLEKGNCIFIGGKTFVVTYQENDFFSNDSHNLVLYVKNPSLMSQSCQLCLACCIYKSLKDKYTWGDSVSYRKIQKDSVFIPTKNNAIDFEFMESFIAELEAQRIAELEAYLSVTGLKDTCLSPDEEQALREFDETEWYSFNLEKLFGKSTRGKRLKSADRVSGGLPFVTAGEADEGISAFIGNNVDVFSKGTTTIDMFGSAKYRSYDYGGDDHVAVVHTEKLPRYAAVFVTSAIHKSSHNGRFDYGHNFYAKDADALYISLPVTSGQGPDYAKMETIISAIQKLVIRDVVAYSNRKIEATQNVVGKYERR